MIMLGGYDDAGRRRVLETGVLFGCISLEARGFLTFPINMAPCATAVQKSATCLSFIASETRPLAFLPDEEGGEPAAYRFEYEA
jgi:hypothetical protein